MEWFEPVFVGFLGALCIGMIGYHAWRAAKGRDRVLYALGPIALYASLGVMSLPIEPRDLGADWQFWLGAALLLLSVVFSLWDKRRSKQSANEGDGRSGGS